MTSVVLYYSINTMNYYEILGLTPEATSEEIKRAFRKKALKYHPDVNRSPDATAKFKEMYEAYGVLSNMDSRAEYDFRNSVGSTTRIRNTDKATIGGMINYLEDLFDVIDELKDMDWATYEKEGRQKEKALADYMRKMARDST